MTRTAGAQIGCQRPSRFWGLGCPKIFHEAEDTLDVTLSLVCVSGKSLALPIGYRCCPACQYGTGYQPHRYPVFGWQCPVHSCPATITREHDMGSA
ncbi:hypothetical protein [Thiolapillus sp.]|uniref:hypothetical protein n=2 Tax=Thiolapillus sp. TaxID=2017437 RepID=UPI0025DEAAD4|nr:hypothetical protein [Thiolapillus sp.]